MEKTHALLRFYKRWGVLVLLLVLVLACTLISSHFLTVSNLMNILKQISVIVIIAFGECMLIVAGQTDLSPGSVVASAGVVAAMVYAATLSLPLAIGGALLVGLATGAINGALVVKFDLPPFIVTLGTQTLMRGFALYISNGVPVLSAGGAFKLLGQGSLGPIPFAVILVAVMGVLFSLVMNRTSFGRYLYAIGGNQEAARASGIPVNRIKLYAFILCGMLSGLAGFVLASRLNVGQPNVGSGYEFDAIIGVILGGASFTGGTGSILGTVIGCMVIGVLNNILNLVNVSAYLQDITKGVLILAVVTADAVSKRAGKPAKN